MVPHSGALWRGAQREVGRLRGRGEGEGGRLRGRGEGGEREEEGCHRHHQSVGSLFTHELLSIGIQHRICFCRLSTDWGTCEWEILLTGFGWFDSLVSKEKENSPMLTLQNSIHWDARWDSILLGDGANIFRNYSGSCIVSTGWPGWTCLLSRVGQYQYYTAWGFTINPTLQYVTFFMGSCIISKVKLFKLRLQENISNHSKIFTSSFCSQIQFYFLK